jgi:hypothetical protein
METFDLVVMIVGGLLIAAGCVLFVTGKVAGSNNKIEAFGIKMDVSNPSLILLAAGIGLLLVPRLLPAPHATPVPASGAPRAATPAPPGQEVPASAPQVVRPPAASFPRPVSPPRAATAPPSPSIAGNYVLLSAMENGIYTHVEAVLAITPTAADRYGWYSAFQVFDQFGGLQTLEYQGEFIQHGGAWSMVITGSSDPRWYGQQQIPLGLAFADETLELRYVYNGAQIVSVWEQQ